MNLEYFMEKIQKRDKGEPCYGAPLSLFLFFEPSARMLHTVKKHRVRCAACVIGDRELVCDAEFPGAGL